MGRAKSMFDLGLINKERKRFLGKRTVSSIIKKKKPLVIGNPAVNKKPQFRYLHQAFPPGSWKDNRCFIVAGGESLKGFDFSLLDGELVIAVNRAMEYVPQAEIMLAQDSRLWGWYESGDFGKEAKDKFESFKGIKAWVNTQEFPFPDDFCVINVNKYSKELNADYSSGLPFCTNCGLNAILLAACLGADTIYLLGFDGDGDNFHGGYPEQRNNDIYKDVFIPDFEHYAPQIKRLSKVVNLNQNSSIRCFDFGEFPKKDVFFEGYAGIGDNLWQRPFIKEICKRVKTFYLHTYTPQMYWDIPNIKFVKPHYKAFKIHQRNIADTPGMWVENAPAGIKEMPKPAYWAGFRFGLSIADQFEDLWHIKDDYNFRFPVKEEWVQEAKKVLDSLDTKGKKICIVHFPTQREDWQCPARDPKPEYLQLIIDRYKDEYFFISLADLEHEYFTEAPRGIDKEFHRAELTLNEVIGLVRLADMVVSGNCYLFTMGLSIGTKTFYIGGGCQDINLFIGDKYKLPHLAYIQPDPFCNCLDPRHSCEKDIPEDKIISTFEGLKTRKKNILFYKVGPRYHADILNNEALADKYNYTIINEHLDDLKGYIKEHKISLIITTNYPPEEIKELGIEYIFFEAFIGNDKVFDRCGFHFTPENEIKRYVDKVKMLDITLPGYTKVEQPNEISAEAFFNLYDLNPKGKYIVLLGQELGDKSLLASKNPNVRDYYDYIDKLFKSNPDVKFIFKPHPVYFTIKKHLRQDIEFICNYPNVVTVYESIYSLFKIFDRFTAFSSTTIFEGLMRNKKFATVGYHFCSDPKVVFELTDDEKFTNLYSSLGTFEIDKVVRDKYINFILNYYSMNLADKRVVERIEKTSGEYYAS